MNFAIRPRGAKDMNIAGKHRRESILVHENKGCREGAAVRKDRTLGGGVDAMIVIKGEDADEARLVAKNSCPRPIPTQVKCKTPGIKRWGSARDANVPSPGPPEFATTN